LFGEGVLLRGASAPLCGYSPGRKGGLRPLSPSLSPCTERGRRGSELRILRVAQNDRGQNPSLTLPLRRGEDDNEKAEAARRMARCF